VRFAIAAVLYEQEMNLAAKEIAANMRNCLSSLPFTHKIRTANRFTSSSQCEPSISIKTNSGRNADPHRYDAGTDAARDAEVPSFSIINP
jgi:hypothetical protein